VNPELLTLQNNRKIYILHFDPTVFRGVYFLKNLIFFCTKSGIWIVLIGERRRQAINGTEKNKEQNIYLEKIIREYADMIYRIAYQYTGNFSDAEDILQDVSMALVTQNPPLEDKTHLKYWICRVTINKCKNLYKRKKIFDWQELKEDSAVYEPQFPYIKEELFKLPTKYRTVLYLYYFEEYSIEEISKILKLSPNTVGSQLRRGRERLKKLLEGE